MQINQMLLINTCIKRHNMISLKKKKVMKNKTLLNECKCIHCHRDQIVIHENIGAN